MYELIKITEQKGRKTVSARELHAFLGCTERFSTWFERQLQYGFEENTDYVGCKTFHALANQELKDYAVSVSMAKELSMLARNEKGKQARRYFIGCEKVARTGVQQVPGSFREALLLAAEQQRVIEEKQKLIAAQGEQIEVMSGEIIDLKKKTELSIERNSAA